jgi:uncharacterized protein (TIGR02246 family)
MACARLRDPLFLVRTVRSICWVGLVGLCVGSWHSLAWSQEASSPGRNEKAKGSASQQAADLAAIRAASREFAAAFNQGNAKALAALWTEDGDLLDESGSRLVGRKAIEAAYAGYFAQHPQGRMQIVIDDLRLLSEDAAIEDGRAIVDPPPAGAPGIGKYTAVHVKRDGKWLMSTVRESRLETPSNYRHVADWEWLIGTWTAEEHGAKTESVCRWIANKSFVERTYRVTHADGTLASGVQIIGLEPGSGRVQSWNFSSDGGYATGVWTPHEGGWTGQIRGFTGNGTPTTAVNRLTRLDDNAYAWQSVERTVGGEPVPDTDEVVHKRSSK